MGIYKEEKFMLNFFGMQKRMRLQFFATWAKMNKQFDGQKHYLSDNAICYDANCEEYANHIEMAGFYCSSIISYGIKKDGTLRLMRHVIFPNLRLYPNTTHCSLDYNFKGAKILIDGIFASEKVERFVFDGVLNIYSSCNGVGIKRTIFAGQSTKACCEKIEVVNNTKSEVDVKIIADSTSYTKAKHGVDRKIYRHFSQIENSNFIAKCGETTISYVAYCGADENENFIVNCQQELVLRKAFINSIAQKLVVTTPNETLNAMTFYAKIRASESIFKTKGGLMHSPGGGGYYAALWTNDQCEYVNPFFAYLGYDIGIEESLNCYELYKKYISNDKALITSIISGGDNIWHGAKDRGDSAMYAYGCSRFLLTLGNKEIAKKYLSAVRDCIDFSLSQINSDGVVKSDSDELENRFESGKANLCTSCLTYDALISCSYLENEVGDIERAKILINKAEILKQNIEKYFGANVEGYDTYRYCKEESKLRSWIAMPLVVGIFDRKEKTAEALLCDKLKMREGLVTRSGEKTFWDRSTLYSLRGLFNADMADSAIQLLEVYSTARLLGAHIPYAVEAFPEGNQAQLSAESGLYVRIIVEGILGYRPLGFSKFEIAPHLPTKWNDCAVHNILLCGKSVDIDIKRIDKEQYELTLNFDGKKVVEVGDRFVVEI